MKFLIATLFIFSNLAFAEPDCIRSSINMGEQVLKKCKPEFTVGSCTYYKCSEEIDFKSSNLIKVCTDNQELKSGKLTHSICPGEQIGVSEKEFKKHGKKSFKKKDFDSCSMSADQSEILCGPDNRLYKLSQDQISNTSRMIIKDLEIEKAKSEKDKASAKQQ